MWPVPSPRGDFGGLSPPQTKLQVHQIETWNTIHRWSFGRFLECQAPPQNRKAPYWKLSGDGSECDIIILLQYNSAHNSKQCLVTVDITKQHCAVLAEKTGSTLHLKRTFTTYQLSRGHQFENHCSRTIETRATWDRMQNGFACAIASCHSTCTPPASFQFTHDSNSRPHATM